MEYPLPFFGLWPCQHRACRGLPLLPYKKFLTGRGF